MASTPPVSTALPSGLNATARSRLDWSRVALAGRNEQIIIILDRIGVPQNDTGRPVISAFQSRTVPSRATVTIIWPVGAERRSDNARRVLHRRADRSPGRHVPQPGSPVDAAGQGHLPVRTKRDGGPRLPRCARTGPTARRGSRSRTGHCRPHPVSPVFPSGLRAGGRAQTRDEADAAGGRLGRDVPETHFPHLAAEIARPREDGPAVRAEGQGPDARWVRDRGATAGPTPSPTAGFRPNAPRRIPDPCGHEHSPVGTESDSFDVEPPRPVAPRISGDACGGSRRPCSSG